MTQRRDLLYKVAIYLRLSKDDGDFSSSNNRKLESDSIHNQRELLHAFLAKHPEMELIGEYKDDGYTGTNFDRPDFIRMMEDLRKDKFNCIIVKDLSRFGRDYIECGKYIEKIFPQLGVRFIAVNDGFDTISAASSDSIVIPFKNLINDSYSRDISIKVRSNLDAKRRRGKFISNFAVYGYCKDPMDKNHLIIDEYAADMVRDIFRWKIAGLSPIQIAKRLNDAGILSPMEYKKSQGSHYKTTFNTTGTALWSHVAVRRILTNEVYTGVLVQGKRTTPNYKTKKFVYKSKEEWVRVEDAHEPIILQAQFDLVQQLLKEDTRTGDHGEAVYPYSGRIFCADCGSPAMRKTVSSGGRRYVYYVCGANKADKSVCSKHTIREDSLNLAVLETVRHQIAAILDIEKTLDHVEMLAWENAEIKKIESNIAFQEDVIEKNNALRLGVYEDLQAGILTREEFMTLKEEFAARIAAAKEIVEQLTRDKNSIRQGLSQKQSWLSQFRKYENITEVTRMLVVNLIERINVYEDQEIEVVFRQRDQFADIMQFWAERQKQSDHPQFVVLPRLEVI